MIYKILKTQIYLHTISILSFLVSWMINRNREFDIRCIHSVLVIRPDRLGDLIMSLPVLDRLSQLFSPQQLTAAISQRWMSLFESEKRFKVINYESFEHGNASFLWNQFRESVKTVLGFRNQYDLMVDLRGDLATVMLAPFLGIKYRIDWGTVRTEEKLNRWLKISPQKNQHGGPSSDGFIDLFKHFTQTVPWKKHYIQTNISVFRYLNINVDDCIPRLHQTEENIEWGTCFLKNRGLDPQRIIWIHPGSGKMASPSAVAHSKIWPIENFIRLSGELKQAGYTPAFILGSNEGRDVEEKLADEIILRVSNLEKLAALLSFGKLFIGHDTGITHLASACGCPTLALFGPTDPAQFGPVGEQDHAIVAEDQWVPGIDIDIIKENIQFLFKIFDSIRHYA